MPLIVKITGHEQLRQQALWLMKLEGVVDKPEALVPAIRQAGKGMRRNFQEERSPSGHAWQHLTYYTLFDRAEKGHMGGILHRSGQLEQLAAGTLESWRAVGQNSSPPPLSKPYNEGDSLKFVGSVSSRRFHASLTGERVKNQFGRNEKPSTMQSYFSGVSGFSRFGEGYLPARPFWGFNDTTVRTMATASMLYIMQEWQSQSGGIASLHTGFASTMGEGAR